MIPNTLMHFVFFYPLIMAWVWMIGGIVFYFHWERRNKRDPDHLPYTGRSAPCSIIIPCFNEAEVIRDTIHYAHSSEYPDFEVIAVNDGSTDSSAEILEQLTREYPACASFTWPATRARPLPCAQVRWPPSTIF